jgi:hypothetical protein
MVLKTKLRKLEKETIMKTYKVLAQYVTYVYAFIEAENEEQAWDIAREMDGGVYKDSGYGDWDIDSVEEVI